MVFYSSSPYGLLETTTQAPEAVSLSFLSDHGHCSDSGLIQVIFRDILKLNPLPPPVGYCQTNPECLCVLNSQPFSDNSGSSSDTATIPAPRTAPQHPLWLLSEPTTWKQR